MREPTRLSGCILGLLIEGGIAVAQVPAAPASGPVADGLILHLDAEAQIAAGGQGADNARWQNLAVSPDFGPVELLHFAGDTTSGWQGNGSPQDPYCLRFDGKATYGVGSGSLELPELTLEAWARVEDVGGRPTRRGATLIGNDFSGGGVGLLVHPDSGSLILLHGVTFTPISAEIPKAEWVQVVGAFGLGRARIYVNGALVAVVTAPRELRADHYPGYQLGVARHPGNDYVEADGLIGSLAIVRAYNRALSGPEVRRNFEADRARFGIAALPERLEPVTSVPVPGIPGLDGPPVRCARWDYQDSPVRVWGPGGPPWPYGPRWALDGYPTSLAQPYVRNYWRAELPQPDAPVELTVDYRRPVAVTRFVHYFDHSGATSAWRDVDVLSSQDQEEWAPVARFRDLTADAPQVLPIDEPRPAPYYRFVIHSLGPGAITIASHEIATYYGTTVGSVGCDPSSPSQSKPCKLSVRIVSPDASCEGAALRVVAPKGALRGDLEQPVPAIPTGGRTDVAFPLIPLAHGPIRTSIELRIGKHVIDRRPFTMHVQPKLALEDLSLAEGVAAQPGERLTLAGTARNAGQTVARGVRVTWMGEASELGTLQPGESAHFRLVAQATPGCHPGALLAAAEGDVRTELRRPVVCGQAGEGKAMTPMASWRFEASADGLRFATQSGSMPRPLTGTLQLLANGQPVRPVVTRSEKQSVELAAIVPGAAFHMEMRPSPTGNGDVVLRCVAVPNDPNPLTPPWVNLEFRLAVDDPRVMFRPHIDWYTAEHGPNVPQLTNGHQSATRMLCIQTGGGTVSMVPDTDNLTWGFTPENAITARFQLPLAPHDPLGEGVWRPLNEAPTSFDLTLCARPGDWWDAYRHVVHDLFRFEQPRQWALPVTQMQMLATRATMRPEVWSEKWQTVRSHPGIDFFYNFYGTTYTLPTLYSWYLVTDDQTARERAEKVLEWLLSVQEREGPAAGAWFSQYCVEGDPPQLVGRDQAWNRWIMPHAGGSAAKTLLWYWEASGKHDARALEAARRCCDWLVRIQRADGGWPYALDLDGKPVTDLADAGQMWCTWALWRMHAATGDEAYRKAALASRDFFRRTFMDRHRYEGYWEDVSGAGGQVSRSWEGYEPAIAALVFADMGDRDLAIEAAKDAATWSWTRVTSTRQYETAYGQTTEQSLCGPSQAQSPMIGVGLQRVFELTGDRLFGDLSGAIKAVNFAADPDQAYGMVATGGWDDPTTGVVGPPYENVRPLVTPNNSRGDEYGRQVWNEWCTNQFAWLALEWLVREGNLRAPEYVSLDPDTFRGAVLGRPGRVKMPEERCDVTGIEHYDVNWVGYQNDAHYVLAVMNHHEALTVLVRPHEAHLGCYTRPPRILVGAGDAYREVKVRKLGVQYAVDIPEKSTALLIWDRMT